MTGRILVTPPREHHCYPGWRTEIREDGSWYGVPPSSYDYPKGTVWACGCGRTWISRGAAGRNSSGFTWWRREGRLARWRRERQAS